MAGVRGSTVVVATRNRRAGLLQTLDRLVELPERPPVIVVDNGSSDGTPAAVRSRHPAVEVIALGENRAALARNVGTRAARTPCVAFSDDDSWWESGALAKAETLFSVYSHLGLIAAKIVVEPGGALDPTCAAMASSPLGNDGNQLPGPRVLGFVACGSVVRRSAFLKAGGFSERLWFGGEERLLAVDLAAAGWAASYVDGIVAHHEPASERDPAERRRLLARNALWFAWLRRPFPGATAATLNVVRKAATDASARAGIGDAFRGAPAVLRERRPVSSDLERAIRRVGL
jgi:GT2 family glycosyltransferase